jgi:putative ABC transport system permease protein
MLRSIIITAFRNIIRNRSFSFINLFGLSVGMSLGLLIIMVIKEQYSFDSFHYDDDRIFRVNTRAFRVSGGSEDYASVPLPIGTSLMENYSFVDKVVRINRSLRGDAVYGNINVPLEGLIADQSFFEVFNFPFEKGNPATALKEANGIVLTNETARKIFGQSDPLGQVISLPGIGDFKVTGVLKKFIKKTHLEFEAIASMDVLPVLERLGTIHASLENWNNYYFNYVYVKLKQGGDQIELEKALSEIYQKNYNGLKLETRDKGYEFYLMGLNEITPGPELSNQMGRGLPMEVIILIGSLAAVVMIMACFNYTNLMIAKSLSRAREIGVRKVIGARRWQVFLQFVGEAVVFSFFALVISYLLLQLLKPAFMQLHITQEFSVDLNEDGNQFLYFIAFAFVVGIVAGMLPASYLSAFRPVKVLKDAGNLRVYSRLTFRRVLMVTQFALSLFFIMFVTIVYRQIDYMFNKDYGIKEDNIVNVRLQGMEFEKLANEVKQFPGVVRVGAVSHALGTWSDRSSDYKRTRDEEPFVMRDFIVDNNYLDNIGVEFVAGKNFDPATEGAFEKNVILNETALKQFSLKDPVSAIGQTIYTDDSVMLNVIGVVRDFHFRPLNYEIGPVALRYNPKAAGMLSMRIVPSEKEKIIASLEAVWKTLDPVHPLEWIMMDHEIDQAYETSGFTDIVKIVGYIAFLAITLACLGMLGMAMYAIQTRVKEIGVRKVMGASVYEITVLLSKSFALLIGFAVLMAVPASFYMGDLFLSNYAYRAAITPWTLLFGVVLVLVLGLITICSQTMRAAGANPVKSLRYE